VTISISNAFEFTNLAEVKELRGSSYGNSLIETISLSLQNNGGIADVQKLLEDLLWQLNKDHDDATAKWTKEKKELEDKEKELQGLIEELRKTILDKEGKSAELKQLIEKADKNLQQYKDQKIGNDKNLKDLEKQRNDDSDEYKKSASEHSDIINAISQVIEELKKLLGSVSGVGKPASVEEIAQETRDREFKLKNSFVQVTRDETEALLFAQLATTADQEALDKLISLLRDLQESTKKSSNEDESHEEKSKATYEVLKASFTTDNQNLDKNIKDQGEKRTDYAEKKKKLDSEITDHKKIKTSTEAELEEKTKEKLQKEAQYNSDKLERDNERVVIKKLQEIVKERLANMSKFLKDQTGAF